MARQAATSRHNVAILSVYVVLSLALYLWIAIESEGAKVHSIFILLLSLTAPLLRDSVGR
jgi:hypothetical protein